MGGNGATVVADETFYGGKASNRHRQGKPRRPVGRGSRAGGGTTNLQPVLSLIDTQTGEVRSRAVPDITGATLRKVIAEHVDMGGSVLHTDAGMQYRPIAHEFLAHEHVDHSHHEYVRYDGDRVITNNQAENFFSQLKRSLDGTHHHVSRQHLNRYLAEFDFRYTTKKVSDTDRMLRIIDQSDGRRLSYRAPHWRLSPRTRFRAWLRDRFGTFGTATRSLNMAPSSRTGSGSTTGPGHGVIRPKCRYPVYMATSTT